MWRIEPTKHPPSLRYGVAGTKDTLRCRWSPITNNGGGPTNGSYRFSKEREVSLEVTGGTLYVNPRKHLTVTGSIGLHVRVSNKRLKGVRVSGW